jgi:hypothetical protein
MNDNSYALCMGYDGSDYEIFLAKPVGECYLVPDETIVPKGGTLGFQATVTNNTDKSGSVLFSTKVTLPQACYNGGWYPTSDYLIGPLSLSLNPFQSKSGHRSHAIPLTAPLGIYTYHGYVGNYGATKITRQSQRQALPLLVQHFNRKSSSSMIHSDTTFVGVTEKSDMRPLGRKMYSIPETPAKEQSFL